MSRILLADHYPAILEGIVAILTPRYQTVGTFRDGPSLVEAAMRLQPNVIILELTAPLINGIDAARQIKAFSPETKLLFFTMAVSPTSLAAAQRVGADGLVLKSALPDELLFAVDQIVNGHPYWPFGIASDLRDQTVNPHSCLSLREQEVLQMIADGHSAKDIAFDLNISIWTANFHRQQIKKKLGLCSTAELTRYALEQGFI